MDNGLEGSPPPTRDGRGNTRRVIGIRRINYSGTGLPPVETASSTEDIHGGGASTSEPLPEKQSESPEPPSSPELPALNQEEIQVFYRESLLAMQAADSARKLAKSTTPDNELVFYDSASSGSQATNPETLGSRSNMAQSAHEDRMSLRSVLSGDLRCKGARATTQTSGVHSSRVTTPTSGASISRATTSADDRTLHATTPVADAQRATTPAADNSISRATASDVSVSRAPAAHDSVSRATTPATDDDVSRATTPATDDDVSRVTAPAAHDSVSRVPAPAALDSVSRAPEADGSISPTPAANDLSSRATRSAADDVMSRDPVKEVESSTRETTGIRKRIRRAFSRLLRPFRSCFGHS